MYFLMKIIFIFVFSIIFTSLGYTQQSKWGPATGTYRILTMLNTARAAGMASTYTGYASDISAVYYNPAGLINLSRTELNTSYLPGFTDDYLGSINLGIPILKWLAVSAGYVYYDGGNIELLSGTGMLTKVKAAQDSVGLISCALGSKSFSIGINGKLIQSKLLQDIASRNTLYDVGLLIKIETLRLGIAVQNLGPDAGYTGTGTTGIETIPRIIRGGIAIVAPMFNVSTLVLAGDAILNSEDMQIREHIGIELWLGHYFIFRIGQKIGYPAQIGGLTLGLGLNLSRLSLDYALVDNRELKYSHRVSISFKI